MESWILRVSCNVSEGLHANFARDPMNIPKNEFIAIYILL